VFLLELSARTRAWTRGKAGSGAGREVGDECEGADGVELWTEV
jgi:hypothetical protein